MPSGGASGGEDVNHRSKMINKKSCRQNLVSLRKNQIKIHRAPHKGIGVRDPYGIHKAP